MDEQLTGEQFFAAADKAELEKRPMIALFQDIDGNWRGAIKKGETIITVRDIGPETVLQRLLTHDGKTNT